MTTVVLAHLSSSLGGIAGLNTREHLISTLAHQISLSISDPRRYTAQAIESDPSIIFSGSLDAQLQTLIVNPLLQAQQLYPGDRRSGQGKRWARARLIAVIDGSSKRE